MAPHSIQLYWTRRIYNTFTYKNVTNVTTPIPGSLLLLGTGLLGLAGWRRSRQG